MPLLTKWVTMTHKAEPRKLGVGSQYPLGGTHEARDKRGRRRNLLIAQRAHLSPWILEARSVILATYLEDQIHQIGEKGKPSQSQLQRRMTMRPSTHQPSRENPRALLGSPKHQLPSLRANAPEPPGRQIQDVIRRTTRIFRRRDLPSP
jgi:hypothetical protein